MDISKERAQEIKEQILDKIVDHIPSSLVDPLWKAYLEVVNPKNKVAECTCDGKSWGNYVRTLRERVTEILNAEVYVVENQEVKKKDTLEQLQEKAKQRHKKK